MPSSPPYHIAYDPKFLGEQYNVPLPTTCCKGKLVQAGEVFDYIHFSLVMHQDRRSALYTAHNIDYSQKNRARSGRWDTDARIESQFQIDNHAYYRNEWDRGHLVRRDAVVWGSRQRAQDASDSTYFYPNAALQHEAFNQSNSRWLGLEDWILHKAGAFANRLCVFTGPIYTEVDITTDRGYTVPSAFWKIVVLLDPTADGNDLSAVAFLMKQNENWRNGGLRALSNLQPYHVSIAEIEAYTGLNFGEIADLDEFDWRQVRFSKRSLMPPILVEGPDDIVFSGDRRRAAGIRASRKFTSNDEIADAVSVRSATPESKDCGCAGGITDMEQEIKALKKQTTALCEIIEHLVENNHGNFNERAMGSLNSLLSRVIGGSIVQPGAFPECVAVGNDTDGYFCTGILVDREVVLTAAHCADYPITKVLLNTRQISNTAGAEIIEVIDVAVHPEYSLNRIPWHDIAVLILKEPANTDPVEIATVEEVMADDSLILVGFGSDDPDGISGFGTKRRVDVSLTVNSSPAETLHNQQLHGYDVDYEFHGGRVRSGMDTCNGDSGGPAYIQIGGVIKVAGLTSRMADSATKPCGDGGIYTLIDAYSDWLYSATDGRIGTANPVDDDEDEEVTGASGGLYISAAVPNPQGEDAGNEWVEITNNRAVCMKLDGYSIADRQGGQEALTGKLASGDTLRFVFPEGSPVQLSNKNDDIVLLLNEEPIHEVTYARPGQGEVIVFDTPEKTEDKEKDQVCDDNGDTGGGGNGGGNGGGGNGGGGNGGGDDDECKCKEEDPPGCSDIIDPAFTPGALRC